jgi:predicted DNA-binding transcriptional regulator AlpA
MNIQLHQDEIQAIADSVAAIVMLTIQKHVEDRIEKKMESIHINIAESSPRIISDDDLLDQAEVAKIVGMSEPWLEKKRCAGGGIPFVKLGRSARYRRSDVLSFIHKNTKNNSSEI